MGSVIDMKPTTKRFLIRLTIALAMCLAIAKAIDFWLIQGRDALVFEYHGREVDILAPYWFYLAALTPYIWLVRGESLSDMSLIQQTLSVGLRGLLVCGIALALARPTIRSEEKKIATVVLVDVSASISDKQLAAAQQYLDDIYKAKKKDDQVFTITFAERPHMLENGKGGTPPVLARHEKEGLGTDIQAALQLAYGLYPPGYIPRALIVSDGNQTSGDILAEAYKAQEFGVKVSWQIFAADRVKEIRVVALHLPDEIKAGAPFDVVGEVWSTQEQQVTLYLRQDDFPNGLEPSKTVTLHEGVNRVSFKSEAKAGGYTTYQLTLKEPPAGSDTEKANNSTVATAPVKGKPHILYVEGEQAAATYLERALKSENMDVEVRGPRGVPYSAADLSKFDLLLVSDVPAQFIGDVQMNAIQSYVSSGGGFIMTGGQDSFGSGGYENTKIEQILPVRFDSQKDKEQPTLAIALIIDRSGSMSGEKLEMAKEAARATAEILEPTDMISVIAFDNSPITIVRLQKASNRLRISTDIARLQPGGGTNILPALQEAYNVLAPVNAKVKHAILLSDGQAGYEGIAEICDEMRANRITVSSVAIGDADRNLLNLVAEHGDGKALYTDNASELPRIFVKETQEIEKSSLVEDVTMFHVTKRVEAIEGTGVDNAPYLHGYVTVKPKPTSEVIGVSDQGDPLLARWHYGAGQVVAWTSDVKNRWGYEWLNWPGYSKFWAQIVRTTMRNKQLESYDMAAYVVGGKAHVVVDAVNRDDRFVNDLETTLVVKDPRDSHEVARIPMDQTAAGRYETEFNVDRYGTYILEAEHRRNGQEVAKSVGAVALPYPAEYLKSTPDEEPLRQTGVITGGWPQPLPARLFDAIGEKPNTYDQDLWPYVLLLVAAAFIFDVYLRRVRIFGYRAMKF